MTATPRGPKSGAAPPTAPLGRLQMADLARMAGVSTSTVSRALSGSTLVNEETRKRIGDLARSLNYSVNIGAQNLRLRQNRTVAVVIPYDALTRQHITDPFFQGMLGSLADALTDRGHDMLLSRVDADELSAVEQLQRSGRAIGIIMIGQWRHHDQLNELAAQRFPIVVWGAQLPQQLYCCVGGDNLAGGRLATRHLLEQGRRRIAFFGDTRLPEVAQRYEGYRQAHDAVGVTCDPELCLPVAFIAEPARTAVLDLLECDTVFDALFACSDLQAITAINTLRERGLRTPEDIAVVGYDDIELAQYFHPRLTTVRQPIEAAARALVDTLLALLDGQRPDSTVLPTELVVRASSVTVD